MSLHTEITDQLKDAMRAKDAVAMNVLRALKSALKYAAIEKLGAEGELDPTETIAVVRKQIKQRRDSFESFTTNNRPELTEKSRPRSSCWSASSLRPWVPRKSKAWLERPSPKREPPEKPTWERS